MFGKIFLLMILVPLVDFYILYAVSFKIDFWPTVALVILTGIVGHTLFKKQGMHILTSIKSELSQGQMPGDKIISGVIVLIGGVLLMTPGFLTDIVGILFLIPGVRRLIRSYFKGRMASGIQNGSFTVYSNHDSFIDR
jgi:UPF0716 protein FxsA